MYTDRLLIIFILGTYLLSPSIIQWSSDGEQSWFRPFLVWMALIALSYRIAPSRVFDRLELLPAVCHRGWLPAVPVRRRLGHGSRHAACTPGASPCGLCVFAGCVLQCLGGIWRGRLCTPVRLQLHGLLPRHFRRLPAGADPAGPHS